MTQIPQFAPEAVNTGSIPPEDTTGATALLQANLEAPDLSVQMSGLNHASAGNSPSHIESLLSSLTPVLIQLTLDQQALVVQLQPEFNQSVHIHFGSEQFTVDLRGIPALIDWLNNYQGLIFRAFYPFIPITI